MKAPKAPDPVATAQAQGAMNRDTAITQQQLNMVNQVTPYGNLTYSQSGNAFSPSDSGQQYYYNAATGEYRSSAPIASYQNSTSTSPIRNAATGNRESYGETTGGQTTTTQTPVYEDGWEAVKGNLTPQYTATTTLSPSQQALLNQTEGAQLNLATLANDRSKWLQGFLNKGVDTRGVPALQSSIGGGFSGDIGNGFKTQIGGSYSDTLGPGYTTSLGPDYQTTYNTDFSEDRQRVEDAIMARQKPSLDQNRSRLETQLVNRGLRPGSQAWNSELDRLGRSETDARLGAILAGGQEQSRLVGLEADRANFTNSSILNRAGFGNAAILNQFGAQNDAALNAANFTNSSAFDAANLRNQAALANANFNNSARSQGMQEAYAARNQPLNEIAALLSGSQVTNPQFQSTPQTGVAGVDYTGLVNQKYQAEQQAYQSGMGGLFGAGSALLGALPWSDRRLKRDIKRIGSTVGGTPLYSYRMVWGGPVMVGVMADEVPHARVMTETGFYKVDYARVA